MLFPAIAITISFRQPAIENVSCHPKIRFPSPLWEWAFLDAITPASTKNWNNKVSRFACWGGGS